MNCNAVSRQIQRIMDTLRLLLYSIAFFKYTKSDYSLVNDICIQNNFFEPFFKYTKSDYSFINDTCIQNSFFEPLLIFTVSTNETDGYQRYIESAKAYDLPVTVLGLGEKWEGGDMNYRGGGHKVNLLRRALKKYYNDKSTVVMFTDSYDVILLGTSEDLLSRFEALNASIVFSAEVFCWPDGSLASQYPTTESSYKYLNSGGYIGYASDVFNLLNEHRIKNKDDDQLYFSKLFLDKEVRETYRIRLDHKSTIFQSVNGATGELKIMDGGDAGFHLENEVTGTRPLVLHGNGPSKLSLNTLSNYLAGVRVGKECPGCPSLETQLEEFPIVLMGIFIPYNTPFLEEFFDKIVALDYPKDRMHLYLYNKMKAHAEFTDKWYVKNGASYLTSKKVGPDDSIGEALARNLAIERCKLKKCAFFLSVDSVAHLDDPNTLQWLIKDNKGVVGPLLVRPQKAWSNFWGSINQDGFYARSFDYMDIVNNDFRGLWNVPYLTHAYLVNGTLLSHLSGVYDEPGLDPDMAFCKALRDKGVFMYVENRVDAGHLITPDTFDPLLTAPELYEVFNNQQDWERRYIHPNYSQGLDPAITPAQPCPDVFWFPIVTPRFCKELITIMETFGQWSSGSNNDERLAGGYENVPTRDIHMNQVGYERHWLYFLQQYVRPLQERVFLGYFHDPPNSLMNFVVRYRPDEQPSLKPHHDSSTYTINVALNQVGVDYQGGGCRFLRYNCSVTDTKLGWLLIHPGRLTHYHEGLSVLNGTRYIMISFVDP